VQRLPRDLSSPELQGTVGDRELLEIVRHGRAGMPAIPALQSDSDAAVLVAFVRSLSPGRELYGVYCAACHGEDGRGADLLADEGAGPRVVFDRTWLSRQDPEALRGKVWHMLEKNGAAMPHFAGRLSEAQARAIVEHLRRGEGSAGPRAAPAAPEPEPSPAER
jgi:mono/diheme cytochrome c family protein